MSNQNFTTIRITREAFESAKAATDQLKIDNGYQMSVCQYVSMLIHDAQKIKQNVTRKSSKSPGTKSHNNIDARSAPKQSVTQPKAEPEQNKANLKHDVTTVEQHNVTRPSVREIAAIVGKMEGKSNADLGAELGATESSIRSYATKARAKLHAKDNQEAYEKLKIFNFI